MLCKLGVDISKAKDPIRGKRKLIDDIYKKHGEADAVITSVTGGDHRPDSFHYVGLAEDYRGPLQRAKFQNILDDIKRALGVNYDVIANTQIGRYGYIHIEYDKKY